MPVLILAAAGTIAASAKQNPLIGSKGKERGREGKKAKQGGGRLNPQLNGKTLQSNTDRMKPWQYNIVRLNSQPCIIPSSP